MKNSGGFAEYRDGNINQHIGMQRHADCMITSGLQRADRQPDLRLGHNKALLGQFDGDIVIGDRAEQATVHSSFLRQLDSGTTQFFALSL